MIIDLVNTSAFRFFVKYSSTLNSDAVEKSSYGNSLHGITLHYLKKKQNNNNQKTLDWAHKVLKWVFTEQPSISGLMKGLLS